MRMRVALCVVNPGCALYLFYLASKTLFHVVGDWLDGSEA